MKKKPAPKHAARQTTVALYFFGASKAAGSQQKKRGTTREPSMPAKESTGCALCDLKLKPNISGLHTSKRGSVKCTRAG